MGTSRGEGLTWRRYDVYTNKYAIKAVHLAWCVFYRGRAGCFQAVLIPQVLDNKKPLFH